MQLANKFLKDYKQMFRLIKSGETFVAFDTETTGLSAENCRIIEIGAVKFNSTGVISRFSTLINPQQQIPVQITQITHIDDSMVKDKPVIKDILSEFLDFLSDSIVIGHNVQFDFRFLKAECERNGFDVIKNKVIDVLQFCKWAFPDSGKYNQAIMAERFGINVTQAHRAYDDAFVCGNIFLHCIKSTAAKQKL